MSLTVSVVCYGVWSFLVLARASCSGLTWKGDRKMLLLLSSRFLCLHTAFNRKLWWWHNHKWSKRAEQSKVGNVCLANLAAFTAENGVMEAGAVVPTDETSWRAIDDRCFRHLNDTNVDCSHLKQTLKQRSNDGVWNSQVTPRSH